ncbi:MAG TPA: PH domain-containing protein, partial [Arthrobacter sp.]|nr:PH domain-containing protein [Arthrobacter sp.]
RNARPEDLRGLPDTSYGPGKSVRPGDLKTTDSGQAAQLVRGRWQALVDNGTLAAGEAATTAVAVTPRWAAIAVAVLLVAASVWTVAAI